MTDLELLIVGAMVTFISVAGAYVAMRHRANDEPVDSYKSSTSNRHGVDPQAVRVIGRPVENTSHARPH